MLERIGDHAVNIAESAINLTALNSRPAEVPGLGEMADAVRKILEDGLASLFKQDVGLATDVLSSDAAIDQLNISITDAVKAGVLAGTLSFEIAMELVRVSKNLERIADLSTNIAEEANFAAVGVIVKHHAGVLP